jgi:hypothetical protein
MSRGKQIEFKINMGSVTFSAEKGYLQQLDMNVFLAMEIVREMEMGFGFGWEKG